MHVHYPPFTLPPSPLQKKKKKEKKKEKKKKKRKRKKKDFWSDKDFLSVYRKIPTPPIKKFLYHYITPPPPHTHTHSPRPHTSPPPHPAHFFSDLDYLPTWFSVSEFYYKLTKNPNLKKNFFFFFFFFFFCGGGGGVVAGGGVNIMYNCFKWHFCSSWNSNVPNYSEIHA